MENITEENITEDVIVGIDVSKDRLDVAVRPGDACFSVPRTEEGIDNLIRRLGKSTPGQCTLGQSTVRLVMLGDRRIRDHDGGRPRQRRLGGGQPGAGLRLRQAQLLHRF